MPLRQFLQRRRKCGVVAGLIAVVSLVQPVAAGAGSIDGKQAEAARVASEIDKRAGRIAELARMQHRAQARLAQAQDAQAQAEAELRAADGRRQATQERLSRYAVESYVHGGSTHVLAHLFRSNAEDIIYRRTYLQVAMGEDRAVLEDLRTVREDLEARRERLRAAGIEADLAAQELASDIENQRRAEQGQLAALGRIKGELASLVAAEQARRDAAAATAAKPMPTSRPKTAAAPSGLATGDIWECIRQLESGGNYSSPGGGAYQFLDSTWQSLGQTGTASDAPPVLQDAMAVQLQQRSGWDQWTTAPRCGRG